MPVNGASLRPDAGFRGDDPNDQNSDPPHIPGRLIQLDSGRLIQIGTYPWVNKLSVKLLGEGKRLFTFIYDPHFTDPNEGLLPLGFIGLTAFLFGAGTQTGTQIQIVFPDENLMRSARELLHLFYKGDDDDLMAKEFAELFKSPDEKDLWKLETFDDQNKWRVDDAVIQRMGDQAYRIRDGNSLTSHDLKKSPRHSKSVSRDLVLFETQSFLRVRYQALYEKRSGIWPIGLEDGYDPDGETSGFMFWKNGRFLLVDPPSSTLEYLAKTSIPLNLCDGIILTHYHPDHLTDGFVNLLERLPQSTNWYATREAIPTIHKLIELGVNSDLSHLTSVKEITTGVVQNIQGHHLVFEKTVHPFDTVGIEIWSDETETASLQAYISGDTYAGLDLLEMLCQKQKEIGETTLTIDKALKVLRHYFLIPLTCGLTADEVMDLLNREDCPLKIPEEYKNAVKDYLHYWEVKLRCTLKKPHFKIEAGARPIHTPPEHTKKYLDFLEAHHLDVSHVQGYHVSKKKARDNNLLKWKPGHRGWIAFDQENRTVNPVYQRVCEVLSHIKELSHLNSDQIRVLYNRSELVTFYKGETLWEKGTPANSVLIPIDGEVWVKRSDTVQIVEGGLLGQEALWLNRRETDAKARSKVKALVVPISEARHYLRARKEEIKSLFYKRFASKLARNQSEWKHQSQNVWDQILAISEIMTYRKDDEINEGDGLRLILRGHAFSSQRGQIFTVGDFVGNRANSGIVRATEYVQLLKIPDEPLIELMTQNPGLITTLERARQNHVLHQNLETRSRRFYSSRMARMRLSQRSQLLRAV